MAFKTGISFTLYDSFDLQMFLGRVCIYTLHTPMFQVIIAH